MIKTNLFETTEARQVTQTLGNFSVVEYIKDVSNTFSTAVPSYFASKMGVHRKQVVCQLNGSGVTIQSGAMQLMIGNISAETNVKGVGDLAKKLIGGKVTGESAIKPRYTGSGTLVLEPTYKHIILENAADWGSGLVIEDGLFLACSDTVELKVVARKNLSSAVLGGEGLFNTCLRGNGIIALESPVPRSELIEVTLENDCIKIDGNMAVAWSDTLDFTVEKTTKTLVGSAASGEGLVNVYRGTGKVLISPVANATANAVSSSSTTANQVGSALGSFVGGLLDS